MPDKTFVEVRALESELRKSIGGEVRFDDGSRALYAADASNYRQIPIGLVVPRDADDVIPPSAPPKIRGPHPATGSGDQPCGAVLQRRRRARLQQVHEQGSGARP